MRPISSKFLVDSATYKPITGTDMYNNPTYGEDVALSKIYIESPKKTLLNSLGEQASDKLLLFFDNIKSLPKGHTFVKGDHLTYKEQDFIIREAQQFPSQSKPHHWEVRLT